VVWRAVYRAWGNKLRIEQAAVENTEPVYQPLRYQGQYFDAETGLHNNRFRYYDPDAGRFVSHDPIGLAGGVNLYQYAPNPLSWVDPLGLSKCGSFTKNPDEIHFMQSSIKNQTGEHTVLNNAAALKNGTLKPNELPAIKIWQDSSGKLWTLDHRRLAAFKLQG